MSTRTPGTAILRGGGALAVLAVLAVFPLAVTNATVTTIAVDTLVFAAAAVAWNIFSGYSGYISLGHAVFFGTGAYTVGIAARAWQLNGDPVFALLPLAAAVAAVLAVPLGMIALRVRRHTFVVITIAFFFIAQLTATNLSWTGGIQRDPRAVTELGGRDVQRPVLLHRARPARGHDRGVLADPRVALRPAVAGHQG